MQTENSKRNLCPKNTKIVTESCIMQTENSNRNLCQK